MSRLSKTASCGSDVRVKITKTRISSVGFADTSHRNRVSDKPNSGRLLPESSHRLRRSRKALRLLDSQLVLFAVLQIYEPAGGPYAAAVRGLPSCSASTLPQPEAPRKSLHRQGGRNARKTVRWTVFSEGRAGAPGATPKGDGRGPRSACRFV